MLAHPTSMLFFAAAMQGFFLAGVLGVHGRNTQANHILAIWIALLSVDLLQQIYYAEALYKIFPQFISLVNFLPLTYGGFLFLYVRSLIHTTPLQFKDLFHFLFFFVAVIVNFQVVLQSGTEKLQLIEQTIGKSPSWNIQLFALLMPLVAGVYAVLSYRLLQRHPLANTPRLSWLRVMLGLNMIIWIVVWSSILAPNYLHHINSTVIYILVSLVIYMLGYFSLRQPDIFVHGGIGDTPNHSVAHKDPGPKYGDNRLPDDLREHIWSALESYIREHAPWRASNLTLAQLADSTGISGHHISQVLNDHHGISFNDYLNQYRVNAVCLELHNATAKNLLEVAFLCGFSSKSSFNAIFKKHTGKTPSDYRKQFQP